MTKEQRSVLIIARRLVKDMALVEVRRRMWGNDHNETNAARHQVNVDLAEMVRAVHDLGSPK